MGAHPGMLTVPPLFVPQKAAGGERCGSDGRLVGAPALSQEWTVLPTGHRQLWATNPSEVRDCQEVGQRNGCCMWATQS